MSNASVLNNSEKNKKSQYSIAFYNMENLFDTVDDPDKLDNDFLPNADRRWNEKRFKNKVKKLGKVVNNIGYQDIHHSPVIIGLAEVENLEVLKALTATKFLKDKGYDIVHYESPDERGIDNALLYRKDYFTVISSKAHTLYLTDDKGERDYTRDILYVHGTLEKEEIHILVNHWPSRRRGAEETAFRRMAAAKRNQEIVDEILEKDPEARVIIMGDFNDDPHSESIKELTSKGLYNPMELLLTKYAGTLNFRGEWNLFDQILISYNFLQQHGNSFRFLEAKIHNPLEVQEYKGRSKGHPFRTYKGRKYLGGFSDHFPVYSIFTIE